jgi:hypothetical protein
VKAAPLVPTEDLLDFRPSKERVTRREVLRAAQKAAIDKERRAHAVDLAADMEMGYYVDESGAQWPAKPFVIAEVLLRMGYGSWYVKNGRRPRWWNSVEEFRKVVYWKVAVRRMQAEIDLANQHAWAGPLIGLAVEEMGQRLADAPEKVNDRDLAELIVKLTRILSAGRPGGMGNTPPAAPLPEGTMRLTETTRTIDLLPAGPARERAIADMAAIAEEIRASVPAAAVVE